MEERLEVEEEKEEEEQEEEQGKKGEEGTSGSSMDESSSVEQPVDPDVTNLYNGFLAKVSEPVQCSRRDI